MAFFEHRLSDRICSGSRGGPAWSTTRVVTAGGWRQSNRNWSAPLHQYDISFGIKTEDDWQEVRALHYVVGGPADGFRFKDFADFEVAASDGELVAVDGSTTVFQLAKAYRIGSREFLRPITKPVSGSVVVYVAGTPAAPAVDVTTGRVTFVTPPVGALTWAGEFDVPCAFVDELLDSELAGPDNRLLIGAASIKLEEIRT